jgi:ubiquinone/menaquinone biosynthesis C-methylase UbiE
MPNRSLSPRAWCRTTWYSAVRPALRRLHAQVLRPTLQRCAMRPLVRNSDLHELDRRYAVMYHHHAEMHRRAIAATGDDCTTVLEVACGTGWNVPLFVQRGLRYCGLDISETAITGAMAKHPEHPYLNLSVHDLERLADGSFDVVYNSSMLEHIGNWEHAITQMLRIARRELVLCFFEGLTDTADNDIHFHPYTAAEIRGDKLDLWGRKIVLQHDPPGWYWNRYSLRQIERLLSELDAPFTHLDGSAGLPRGESIVHIVKRPAEKRTPQSEVAHAWT